MKKIIAILLTAFLLCGCSSQSQTEAVSQEPEKSSVESITNTKTASAKKEKAEIPEAVIFEESGIRITVKGIEDTLSGVSIKLLAENESDKNITIAGNTFQINNVITLGGDLHIPVAAGKKANGEITFYSAGLKNYGIDRIMSVASGDSWIYDSDSFETIVKPDFEIRTSLYGTGEQEVDISGNVLFDDQDFQIMEKEISQENRTVYLLLHNGSDKDIIVQPRNVSVNDYTINASFSDFITAGTYRLLFLEFYENDFKDNGIDKIESVTFTLKLLDPASYEDIAIAENMTVESK